MSRAAILAAVALTLAACTSGTDTPAPSAAPTHSEAAEHAHEFADHLTLADTWVKAAESGMTAAFGVITNTSDHDVTIVGAHSDATSAIELHEVVDDVMRPVDGGFVVPAGESLMLEPGGYHLMFMDVPAAIVPGDEVTITLELEDGSELTFTAVAKEFSGGNEEYEGDMDMDMDMGGDMSASPSASMGG